MSLIISIVFRVPRSVKLLWSFFFDFFFLLVDRCDVNLFQGTQSPMNLKILLIIGPNTFKHLLSAIGWLSLKLFYYFGDFAHRKDLVRTFYDINFSTFNRIKTYRSVKNNAELFIENIGYFQVVRYQ